MHFGAGVRPDIGKVILAQAAPPANIEGMLAAAEAVEAEQAKKGAPGASALAVAEQAPNDVATDTVAPSFDFAQLQNQISELTEIVSAIASKQQFDFLKIKCYRCGKFISIRVSMVASRSSLLYAQVEFPAYLFSFVFISYG